MKNARRFLKENISKLELEISTLQTELKEFYGELNKIDEFEGLIPTATAVPTEKVTVSGNAENIEDSFDGDEGDQTTINKETFREKLINKNFTDKDKKMFKRLLSVRLDTENNARPISKTEKITNEIVNLLDSERSRVENEMRSEKENELALTRMENISLQKEIENIKRQHLVEKLPNLQQKPPVMSNYNGSPVSKSSVKTELPKYDKFTFTESDYQTISKLIEQATKSDNFLISTSGNVDARNGDYSRNINFTTADFGVDISIHYSHNNKTKSNTITNGFVRNGSANTNVLDIKIEYVTKILNRLIEIEDSTKNNLQKIEVVNNLDKLRINSESKKSIKNNKKVSTRSVKKIAKKSPKKKASIA